MVFIDLTKIDKEELRSNLITIATNNDCMILSFIAPDWGVRISPIHYKSTIISVTDLYKIEEELEKHWNPLPKKLHIIIHTPWGEVYSTVKIAKYLRSKFDYISAYVPYEAASWGTMLCLIADEIVMSEVANLTPIDPQVQYKGERVWVWSYQKALEELDSILHTLSKGEITSPYTDMCEKLDPIIWQEIERAKLDAILTAMHLLESHKDMAGDNARIFKIASKLSLPATTHDHVIDFREAKEIWLNIIEWRTDENYSENLTYYKQFVRIKMKEKGVSHIIESFLPPKSTANAWEIHESVDTELPIDSTIQDEAIDLMNQEG